MTHRLPYSFFNRPTTQVARGLIGCILVRKLGRKIIRLVITETEAYDGFRDKANHASGNKTKRNEILFHSAGHIYVYFTYGMHWMLNVVTGPNDFPAAVLIRGARSLDGKTMIVGPARLTKYLKINGVLNAKKLGLSSGLWIEKPIKKISAKSIKTAPRIGVDYAGSMWANKKWRFILK